jgi:hypothetical protein
MNGKGRISENDYGVSRRFEVANKPILHYYHGIGVEINMDRSTPVGPHPTGLQRVSPGELSGASNWLLGIGDRRQQQAHRQDEPRRANALAEVLMSIQG